MFSAFFIERPKFALVIAIVMTLAGALSVYMLPVTEYPHISPPNIVVNAVYPGASAGIVEATVAAPIEDAVNGVEDMIYMSSKSANDGSYSLMVTFKVGADADMALVRVQNRVKLAEPSLPAEVRAMGLSISERSPDMLKIISFTSPDNSLDYKFISNYVKINLQSALSRVEGISAANILGEADYSMRLWLDPDRMTNLGLSVMDIRDALLEQNVQVAAGKIGAPPFDGSLQTEYTLQAKGRLQDVKVVEELSQYFPDGLEYVISYDTTRYVSTAVNQVLISLFQAVALVIAITFLFLGSWRATLVPAVAIPVSLVATFSVLQMLDMSRGGRSHYRYHAGVVGRLCPGGDAAWHHGRDVPAVCGNHLRRRGVFLCQRANAEPRAVQLAVATG